MNRLRIGTYNIHILADVAGDATQIAEDILSAQLDVVGLQEVDRYTERSGNKDQVEAIADALDWNYGFSKTIDLQGGDYGHGVVSRYPVLSHKTYLLPSEGEEQRVFSHGVILVGERKVNLINVHLSFTGRQDEQFLFLAQYVANLEDYIITGDFNCEQKQKFLALGGNLVNLTPTPMVTNVDGAIDNIIVSQNYTIGQRKMVETNHSDHRLLYAEILF